VSFDRRLEEGNESRSIRCSSASTSRISRGFGPVYERALDDEGIARRAPSERRPPS
jgi:hypothetical protein